MSEEPQARIDVGTLAARIERVAAERRGDVRATVDASLEDLLLVAQARAAVRTRLPLRPLLAPLALPFLRRALLRLLAFASKDQRQINLALIAALRQSAVEQRALAERVRALEASASGDR